MISGIMPCNNWDLTGYPWKSAIRCWSMVCDEIIIVASQYLEAIKIIKWVGGQKGVFNGCNILIRSIKEPSLVGFGGYGSYLLYGCCLASNPDWVIAIEADYLIDPDEALKLRSSILSAPDNSEIILAGAVTMNYTGTRKIYMPDFSVWFPPWDGFTWQRPIGSRIGNGVYPTPFNGIDRFNYQTTCESFIRMRKGNTWGQTFPSKRLKVHSKDTGFVVHQTGVTFEHLTFTKSCENIRRKMISDDGYFKKQGINIGTILNGTHDYNVRYHEIELVGEQYSKRADELRKDVI